MASQSPDSGQKYVDSAWRIDAESRRCTLGARLDIEEARAGADGRAPDWVKCAKNRLKNVDDVLKARPSRSQRWNGTDVERAWVNLHEAYTILVDLADPQDLRGELPSVHALAKRVLKPDDPELVHLAEVINKPVLDAADRNTVVNTMRSAYRANAEQHRRVRSFRNILLVTAAVLMVFALLFGTVRFLTPETLNLCFGQNCPTGRSVPTRPDVFIVELLGVFGTMIVGALAIRRMRGTSTPYAVPLASLLVKLPTGALTAVGGIVLLKAGFATGVGDLEPAQIVAYAVLFGASQQALTQLLDRQAQTVLNSVGSVGQDGAKPKDPNGQTDGA
jgi:uncharacterized membrane protein